MIRSKKHQEGIKLVELLLALVIGASILFFSIRQYQSYRRDADVVQVRSNVDIIFRAMANFFQANCNDPDHPLHKDSEAYYPITLADLKEKGFFSARLARNPLIAQNSPEDGYMLQFNLVKPAPSREEVFSVNYPATQTIKIGTILIWKAQVSVALKNIDTSTSYLALLQADCLSNLGSAGGNSIINPCTATSTTKNRYAVWTRLPSFSSSRDNSPYWLSLPILRQFTQSYYTYPIIIAGNKAVFADQQFFVCGS